MNARLLYISIILALLMPVMHAQVTIGSDNPPHKGSLLDLKQKEQAGENAKGGLALPRVELRSATELTVGGDESKKKEHKGLVVYNVANTGDLSEGTYCWDGEKWKRMLSVDSYGAKGDLLQNNGDNTTNWAARPIPKYQFHRPSQVSMLDRSRIKTTDYSYENLTNYKYSSKDKPYTPAASIFQPVYTANLTIHTGASKIKYLLVGLNSTISMASIGYATSRNSFWQTVQLEIYLTDGTGRDIPVRSLKKTYSSPKTGGINDAFDFYSILPLKNLPEGAYTLKVKLSNVENTFRKNELPYGVTNAEDMAGYFNTKEPKFYLIELIDFNFILYEDE